MLKYFKERERDKKKLISFPKMSSYSTEKKKYLSQSGFNGYPPIHYTLIRKHIICLTFLALFFFFF